MVTNDDNESIIEYSEDIATTERPDPLPVGEYIADIREAKKKSGPKGAYASIQYFISADQYPADYTDGNPDGTTLSGYGFSLEDNARARFAVRQYFENVGLPAPGKRLDLTVLVGQQVKLGVEHEPYNGAMQPRIRSVSRAT